MKRLTEKNKRQARRVKSIRKATKPKSDRLRLVVVRSNRNIRAQIIDDVKQVTICSAGTDEKTVSSKGRNKESAKLVGESIAKRAKEKGVTKVYLDRRGSLYHGRIAEFASAARESGLEF